MIPTQQIFVPGSKWVYIKLYTGIKTADKIIVQDISFIICSLQKKQIIDKWFFVRYSDPDFHLRIRILIHEKSAIGDVILLFNNRLQQRIKTNQIWKIQLDTYTRELERYGGILIEGAETIFYLDSECILSILKRISGKDENYRWMIALRLMDCFLSDFALNTEAKQTLFSILSTSFKAEFGFDAYNSKQFNTKYREHKKTIENVLNDKINDPDFISLYLPIRKWSKRLQPVIVQLQNNIKKQKIEINTLLSSYIHMMLNRLFRSKNRTHELVLYDFMYRYYTSELARKKYNSKEYRADD